MPGSVTNPTGSVKGNSLTGLLDAYTGNFGGSALTIPPQWQHVVLLSGTTGACAREGSGGGYAADELTVRISLFGWWDTNGQLPPVQPAAADLPLTLTVNANPLAITSDGVTRKVQPYFMKARSNGGTGSDVAATAGTVTFPRMDAVQYEGSYDLSFGADHITGSFVAPWCGSAP